MPRQWNGSEMAVAVEMDCRWCLQFTNSPRSADRRQRKRCRSLLPGFQQQGAEHNQRDHDDDEPLANHGLGTRLHNVSVGA